MGTTRGGEPEELPTASPRCPVTTLRRKALQRSPSRGRSHRRVFACSRGSWRAQAAGRLLAPLRSALIVSGVLQAVITLVQLAPFVLLVELARLLVSGADASRLWDVGIAAVSLLGLGTVLGAALTLWLHVVDARFASDLRSRLLSKMSRLPLGWFTARGSGSIKQLVHRRHAVIALSGHSCHPGRGQRRRRAGGGAGLSVRRRLAGGAGLVRAGAGLPGDDVVADDPVGPAHRPGTDAGPRG